MEIPINIRKDEKVERESWLGNFHDYFKEPANEPAEADSLPADSRTVKYLDWTLRLAVFGAVFLAPLFYFASSDTINLSKSLLLAVLALVALVAWIAKIIAQGEIVWRRHGLTWAALAFGAVLVLATFFSVSPWVSFLGDVGRHSTSTASVLSYLIIFLAAVQNLRRLDALWLTVTLVVSVGLAALLALLQFLGLYILPGAFTHNRLFTTAGSVFGLALVSLAVLPIVTELFFSAGGGSASGGEVERRWVRFFWGGLGILLLLVALLINFRVAWIFLALAMLFLIILNFRRSRRMLLPVAVFVIALLFWLVPTIPGPRITNIPVEISPSSRAGFDIIKGAWSESFKNAVLGSGPETFPIVYARYKSPALNTTNFWGVNFNGANAEIITNLSNYGVLGNLAWLAFVLGFGLAAIHFLRREHEQSALTAGVLSSWLFILASKFFYSTPLVLEFYFWLLPALFLINIASDQSVWRFNFSAKGGKTAFRVDTAVFITLIMLLAVSGGGLYLSIQRWVGEWAYAKGGAAAAVSLNPYETRYWLGLAQVRLAEVNKIFLAGQERQLTAEETNQIQNLTLQIFQALERARSLDPQNTARLSNIAEVYQAMAGYVAGATDFAIAGYEEVVELEPINPFLRTRLAQLYLIRDNFFLNQQLRQSDGITKARRQLEKALDLNPNYSNARYFMGFILDREGDSRGALENFARILAFNPNNQAIQLIVRNLRSGFSALGPPRPPQPETPPVRGEEAEGLP